VGTLQYSLRESCTPTLMPGITLCCRHLYISSKPDHITVCVLVLMLCWIGVTPVKSCAFQVHNLQGELLQTFAMVHHTWRLFDTSDAVMWVVSSDQRQSAHSPLSGVSSVVRFHNSCRIQSL
jgi:hypothetical protein